MIKQRQWLAALGIALAMGLSPALSSAAVGIDIEIAPPAPQVEVVPAPRVGYVWAPGYWEWRGGRHVWVGGRWMHERAGYRWVPERWEQRGNRWHFEHGHWDR
jgi:hypothetical protein